MEDRKMRPRIKRGRRKVCKFCADKAATIDYKDIRTLEKVRNRARQDHAPPYVGHVRQASA